MRLPVLMGLLFSAFMSAGAVAQEGETREKDEFQGFYLGIGYGDTSGQETVPLFLGYRSQFDNGLVLGLEGYLGLVDPGQGSESFDIIDGVAAAIVKAGYTPNNSALFYLGAGFAGTDIDSPEIGVSDDGSQDGAIFVGGAEVLLSSWIGLRAEVQFATENSSEAIYGGIYLNF